MIFNELAYFVGSVIILIVAGIMFITLIAAIVLKICNFFFGETTMTQVENPNNEGANKEDENKEIAIYDENSK